MVSKLLEYVYYIVKVYIVLISHRYVPKIKFYLIAPAEGFGLCPMLFLPFGKKRAYYAVFAHFWCPVVTLVKGLQT